MDKQYVENYAIMHGLSNKAAKRALGLKNGKNAHLRQQKQPKREEAPLSGNVTEAPAETTATASAPATGTPAPAPAAEPAVKKRAA